MRSRSAFASSRSRCVSSRSSRASCRALSASSRASRIRSRRWSMIPWMRPNARRRSRKKVIANAITVQTMRPGTTEMRPAKGAAVEQDQDVGEQPADQAVEDAGLGEREAEPLDAGELAAELGLAGDGLDH